MVLGSKKSSSLTNRSMTRLPLSTDPAPHSQRLMNGQKGVESNQGWCQDPCPHCSPACSHTHSQQPKCTGATAAWASSTTSRGGQDGEIEPASVSPPPALAFCGRRAHERVPRYSLGALLQFYNVFKSRSSRKIKHINSLTDINCYHPIKLLVACLFCKI